MINNQKGVRPIILNLAIVGLLVFLAIAYNAPLKNLILGNLFPKPSSYQAGKMATSSITVKAQ